MARANISKAGEFGLITDMSPSELPPNAWTDVLNARCDNTRMQTIGGYEQLTAVAAGVPLHIAHLSNENTDAWIYVVDSDDDGEGEHIYAYTTLESKITRQVAGPADDPYTGTANLWQHTYMSGSIVINGWDDAPQVYDGTATCVNMTYSGANDWEDYDGAGKTYRAKSVRAFKNYLFALHINDNGTVYPHLVHWSDAITPGGIASVNWDYTDDTIDAARRDLPDTDGEIIDGLALRDSFIVYKKDAVYSFTYSGDEFVFRSRLLTKYRGILALNCVVDIGGRHIVIGRRDIYIHDGIRFQSIAQDRVLNAIFGSIDADFYEYTYLAHNEADFEVWVCCVESGETTPKRRWIYDYQNDRWSKADIPQAWFMAQGLGDQTGIAEEWDDETTLAWSSEIVLDWNASLYDPTSVTLGAALHTDEIIIYNESDTEKGVAISASLERMDLDFGETDDWHEVQALYPRMTGNAVTIFVGSQDRIGGPITYDAGTSFDPVSDYVIYPMVSGRRHAIKITGDVFSIDGLSIEYTGGGVD